METRMQRTQILLEPEQYRMLREIARREERSLSDLLREMIHAQLAQRQRDEEAERRRHLAVLEQIEQHRQAILDRRNGEPLDLGVVDLIEDMREERDADVVGRINRHRR